MRIEVCELSPHTLPAYPGSGIVHVDEIRGDVANDPGIGYALAMGMVAVMAVSIGAYALLQRRAERWLR